MNILIIGRGGREHALARSAYKSKFTSRVYVAPGNAGMEDVAKVVDIDELDNERLVMFAKENEIGLTIVGPESALSNGIVDEFEKSGLKIFGPNKNAARIESSKEYAKYIMNKYDIPTASYEVFDDYDNAVSYVSKCSFPQVIKYDGLAAGKGVVIVNNVIEADETLKLMLKDKKYGNSNVIIEEFLDGVEFSLMAFVNGNDVYAMDVSQDHKRAYDNDEGSNTGGMGAYSPVPVIDDSIVEETVKNVMEKTAQAMVLENNSFCGFLYGGLIVTKSGVKVIEFNARFGDPECEVLLPRLESDLIATILDVMAGNKVKLAWSSNYVVGVVLASKGYPETYDKGHVIEGIELIEDAIYHMGTTFDKKYLTNGGRVLLVTGVGADIKLAKADAYNNVAKIKCDNLFYRTDIGNKSI